MPPRALLNHNQNNQLQTKPDDALSDTIIEVIDIGVTTGVNNTQSIYILGLNYAERINRIKTTLILLL